MGSLLSFTFCAVRTVVDLPDLKYFLKALESRQSSRNAHESSLKKKTPQL